MKVTVPAVSFTATLLMLRVGSASSSVMVARPLAEVLRVLPAVVVAVRMKVSTSSSSASFAKGVRTSAEVWPAGRARTVASRQVAPPSRDTCRLSAPAEP